MGSSGGGSLPMTGLALTVFGTQFGMSQIVVVAAVMLMVGVVLFRVATRDVRSPS